MAYEVKDMNGSIFVNDKKTKENHPDRRGSCKIDGVEYWISGWLKDSNGKKWMSLSFTKKEEQQGGQAKSEPAVSDDDSIPF